MTIDDDSSIYVGGLSFDLSEERLRRVFDIYGAVVAIKIINDRATGGKCYGFVTFANPRSAAQAIREMNGKSIDGRVVKVNEVRTRGRPNFNREGSWRDLERGVEGDGRKRQHRDSSYDRHRNRDEHRENYQGKHRERFQDEHKEGLQDYEKENERGHHRMNDRYVEEDRLGGNNERKGDVDQGRVRKRERDWERDINLNEEPMISSRQKSVDKDKHFLNRSTFSDDRTIELSAESLNDNQVESELAVSDKKLEELHKEITCLEDWTADKDEEVSHLREKHQKSEDSLKAAKKLTSYRYMQLEKLHKCYLQLRDYDKRFKNAEEDLQLLVDETRGELEVEGM